MLPAIGPVNLHAPQITPGTRDRQAVGAGAAAIKLVPLDNDFSLDYLASGPWCNMNFPSAASAYPHQGVASAWNTHIK